MTEYWIFVATAFYLGAILSSFACLVVDRLPHQLGWVENPKPDLSIWWPPSQCNSCKRNIPYLHLIPIVGWALAKGRCGYCNAKIPAKYPLLELGVAATATGLAAYTGFTTVGVVTLLLFFVLFFLAWMDWNEAWLPEVVTIPLFWAGLLFSPFVYDSYVQILGAATCFILFAGAFFIVGKLKNEDLMAGGDIAMASAAGAWLGLFQVPFFLFFASVAFIFYALPFRMKGTAMVPMGPALAISFLICMLFGQNFVDLIFPSL